MVLGGRTGCNKGFTLVEAAVSVMVLSLFAGAVLVMMHGLRRSTPRTPWQAMGDGDVWEQFARDVACARMVRTGVDQVTLVGYGSLDVNTRAATLRPCEVIYEVRPAGGAMWLVRRQRSNEAGDVVRFADVMAKDVTRLHVEPVGQASRTRERDLSREEVDGSVWRDVSGNASLMPLPDRLTVTLTRRGVVQMRQFTRTVGKDVAW